MLLTSIVTYLHGMCCRRCWDGKIVSQSVIVIVYVCTCSRVADTTVWLLLNDFEVMDLCCGFFRRAFLFQIVLRF